MTERSAPRRVLRSERVLLPDGAGFRVAPADVIVRGGAIEAVVERAVDAGHGADGEPDDVLDLGDDLLAPAFVNAHTHVSMTAFRGLCSAQSMAGNVVEDLFYRIEKHLQPGDVRAFARMGALEVALSGAGVVWDHYYRAEEVAAALVDVGISGVVAPTLQDRGGPGVDSEDAAFAAVEALDSDAWAARGIVAAYGPHATDTTSDAVWARLADAVAARPLPIHLHLAQTADEYRRSVAERGVGPAARLHGLGAFEWGVQVLGVHSLWIPAAERRLLPPGRFVMGHCPASQVQFAFPALASRWWDDGFRVAIGTDCAASNDGADVQGELRLVAGGARWKVSHSAAADRLESGEADGPEAIERDRAKAWSAEPSIAQLLGSITSVPGALHPKLPTGRIEAGHRATLAVWSANDAHLWPLLDPLRALVFSHTAPALRGLMVEGRWTIELDGRAAYVADPRWKDAAREATVRLHLLLNRM